MQPCLNAYRLNAYNNTAVQHQNINYNMTAYLNTSRVYTDLYEYET